MTLFTEFQWIEAIGWTLLHALWQGLAIALLLRLVLLLIPQRAAVVRYALSVSAICFMLLWAAVTCWQYLPGEATLISAEIPLQAVDAISETEAVLSPVEGTSAEVGALSLVDTARKQLQPYLPYFVILWMIGVLLWSLRFMGSLMYLYRLPRRQIKQPPQHWQRRLAQLQAQLNIARHVRLLISNQVKEPLTMGLLRPVILIPASILTQLPPAQIEAILLHELAHIRRADYFVNMLLAIVEILFFYHPAYWWIAKQVKQEREHCCDDQVVKRSGDQYAYAQALIAVQRLSLTHKNHLAMNFSGNKSQFSHRIQRLFGQSVAAKWQASVGSLVILSLLLLGLFLSPMAQQTNAQQDQSELNSFEVIQTPRYVLKVSEDSISVTYNLLVATENDLADLQNYLKDYDIEMSLLPHLAEQGFEELILDYRGKKRRFVFRNAGSLTMHFFPNTPIEQKSVKLSLGHIPAELMKPGQEAVELRIVEVLGKEQLAKQQKGANKADKVLIEKIEEKPQVKKIESVPQNRFEIIQPEKVEYIPKEEIHEHVRKFTLEFDSLHWVHLNDRGEEKDDWVIMGPSMEIELKNGKDPFWVHVIHGEDKSFIPWEGFEKLTQRADFQESVATMTLLTGKAAAKRFNMEELPVLIVEFKPEAEKFVILPPKARSERIQFIEELSIFPNPSKGIFQVKVKSLASGMMDVVVTDLAGKQAIQPIQRQINGSEEIVKLNLSDSPAGIYLLRVTIGEDTRTERIVIE